MIFEKPLLDSREVTVGGQTLTVYEFTADVYYNELIEEPDVAAGQKQPQTEGDELPPLDKVSRMKATFARNQRFIAAALLPGYPEMNFAQVLAAVKANLSTKQVDTLYTEVIAVNLPSTDKEDPKPATQADPLSTDSPTT